MYYFPHDLDLHSSELNVISIIFFMLYYFYYVLRIMSLYSHVRPNSLYFLACYCHIDWVIRRLNMRSHLREARIKCT